MLTLRKMIAEALEKEYLDLRGSRTCLESRREKSLTISCTLKDLPVLNGLP